jgi:hypothetical protein
MRVTKKVENYIREQVKAKVMPKYEAEKAESERIKEIKSDIQERAAEAARQAALAILEEAKEYTDVLEYNEAEAARMYLNGLAYVVALKDPMYISSVHKWSRRMEDEISKIVDDIIVTLELGGNKADLDRMLSEI